MDEVWILTHVDSNPYDDETTIIGVFSTATKALLEFKKFEFSKDYPILQKDSSGNITIDLRNSNECDDYYAIDRHEVK